MNDVIDEPVKGAGIRHAWGVAVTRALKQKNIFASTGMLLRDGVFGSGVAPLPENRRNRGAPVALPWTFFAQKNEDGEYVGGWRNRLIQIGYAVLPGDTKIGEKPVAPDELSIEIENVTATDDGDHYLWIDLAQNQYKIIVVPVDDEGQQTEDPPKSKLHEDIIVIWIGRVKEHRQISGIHQMPVIYTYA
jgi:hypothetical protein